MTETHWRQRTIIKTASYKKDHVPRTLAVIDGVSLPAGPFNAALFSGQSILTIDDTSWLCVFHGVALDTKAKVIETLILVTEPFTPPGQGDRHVEDSTASG